MTGKISWRDGLKRAAPELFSASALRPHVHATVSPLILNHSLELCSITDTAKNQII